MENMAAKKDKSLLFDLNGSLPPFRFSIPMATQHLFAMIVGSVTPAIILSSLAGMDQNQSVLLIRSSLVTAAIMTFIELFWGAKLPVIMGVSFAYLSSMQAIVMGY